VLNGTAVDFPGATCLHEMFEAQVETAARIGGGDVWRQPLSYRELNEQANQLAHYLRAQGIGPDTLVGLSVERSLEMVVGMMGILKAGGAYVPLDPSYPPERLKYLIEDSAPAMLLTQAAIEERLLSNLKRLRLDADHELLANYPTHNLSTAAIGLTSEHLAYVIYTSGSTGQPKGAMLHHRGVRNRLLWGLPIINSAMPTPCCTRLRSASMFRCGRFSRRY
jgi:non-ribosomal peptide synthetase component F